MGGQGGDDHTDGQVTSSNLDAVYFSKIDPSFVSGTWLLPPVPTHHGQQVANEDLDVHVLDTEHDGDVVGDRGQVPAEENPSVSNPTSGKYPEEHQLYPSASPPPHPIQNPHLSTVLTHAAMETNPGVLDNFVPSSIMEHFALAETSDYSTSQFQNPCESLSLPQILSCTNLDLE